MASGLSLNIDTTKSEFQNPMVQLRQGDGNYQSLSVTVTSNGEPFDLTGWTVTFMGTTAGGSKIVDSAVTVTNALQGEFTYTPTKAWGQDEGEFKNAYFKFVKSDETASGASFRVNVLDAVDLTAEEAGDYISIVDQTISKLNGDLSTLQISVNELKAQNNAIKTTDNTWTGTNTFNKKIIAPAGVQGNADTATKLQTPRKINGTNFDGTSDINVNAANDSNLVHRTGSETVSGDKTFTGNTSFSGGIKGGQVNLPASGDLNTLTDTGKYYQTTSLNVSNWTNRPSNAPNLAFSVDVIGQANRSLATQVYYVHTTSRMWVRTMWMDGATIVTSNWTELANDGTVVHNTGNETIAGDKTFTGANTFSQPINGVNKRINVDNNANINDFLYTGDYIINGPYGVANYPSGANNYGYLHVEWVNNTTTIQTIRTVDLTNYIRSYSGTNPVWSAWKKIVPQSL